LFIKPQELCGLLSQHGLQPGAIRGMLPIWLSPWQDWHFRLVRYTGILYLGYAVKPPEESRCYATSSRTKLRCDEDRASR
jgi:hypothetical protein